VNLSFRECPGNSNLKSNKLEFGSPVVSLRFHRKASRRFKSIKVSADDNRFKTENEGKTIEPYTTPFMYHCNAI
jgi:hypothetical protein